MAGEEAALALYDRVRAAGFAARIVPQQADGGGWTYQLRLGGYASKAEAAVAAPPTSEAPRPTRKTHIPYGVGIAVAGLDFFLVSQHSPFAPFWPWMQ